MPNSRIWLEGDYNYLSNIYDIPNGIRDNTNICPCLNVFYNIY